MSVIIRLQGLPWSASATDIRQFFKGLNIPPGGVHIIGGEKGDAFIAFVSDEDARRAMMMNNGFIDTNSVQLFLSSKTEMQNIIGEARNQSAPTPIEQTNTPQLQQMPTNPPIVSEYQKPDERYFPPQNRFDRGLNRPPDDYNLSFNQKNDILGEEFQSQLQPQRPFDDPSNRYINKDTHPPPNFTGLPPHLRENQPNDKNVFPIDQRFSSDVLKGSFEPPLLRDNYERFSSNYQEPLNENKRPGQNKITPEPTDVQPDRYISSQDRYAPFSKDGHSGIYPIPTGNVQSRFQPERREVLNERYAPISSDHNLQQDIERNINPQLLNENSRSNSRSQDVIPPGNQEGRILTEQGPPYPFLKPPPSEAGGRNTFDPPKPWESSQSDRRPLPDSKLESHDYTSPPEYLADPNRYIPPKGHDIQLQRQNLPASEIRPPFNRSANPNDDNIHDGRYEYRGTLLESQDREHIDRFPPPFDRQRNVPPHLHEDFPSSQYSRRGGPPIQGYDPRGRHGSEPFIDMERRSVLDTNIPGRPPGVGLLQTPDRLQMADRNPFGKNDVRFPFENRENDQNKDDDKRELDSNDPPPFWNPPENEDPLKRNRHQLPPSINNQYIPGTERGHQMTVDHTLHRDDNVSERDVPNRIASWDSFNKPPPGYIDFPPPKLDRPPFTEQYPHRPFGNDGRPPFVQNDSDRGNRPPVNYGDRPPDRFDRNTGPEYFNKNIPPPPLDANTDVDKIESSPMDIVSDHDKIIDNDGREKQHELSSRGFEAHGHGVSMNIRPLFDPRFPNRPPPARMIGIGNPPYGGNTVPHPFNLHDRAPLREEHPPLSSNMHRVNAPIRPPGPTEIPALLGDPDLRKNRFDQRPPFPEYKNKLDNDDQSKSSEKDIDSRGHRSNNRETAVSKLDTDNRQRRDDDLRRDEDRKDRERDRDIRRGDGERYNRSDRSRFDTDRRRSDFERRDERQRDRGREYDRTRDYERSRDYDRSRIERDRDRDSRYETRYRDDRDSRRSPRDGRDRKTDEFGRERRQDERDIRHSQTTNENKSTPSKANQHNTNLSKASTENKQTSVSQGDSIKKSVTPVQSIPIPSRPLLVGNNGSTTSVEKSVDRSTNASNASNSSRSDTNTETSQKAISNPSVNTQNVLLSTSVRNVRPSNSFPPSQAVDPSKQPGLLGAAPPGIRPIQIQPAKKEARAEFISTTEASRQLNPSIVNTKIDADDPKGLKRQYRQATPSLTIVVKNMPLSSGYRDVRKFFNGCEIPWDGLKMINDENGKRLGIAYINFCSSQAYFEALERNGKKFDDNSIEVGACKQEEYDKAIDSYVPNKENEAKKPRIEESNQTQMPTSKVEKKEFIVQIKGWASSVTKEELKLFFKDLKISDDLTAIYVEYDEQKRPTGMAIVKFEKEVDYMQALGMDSKQLAGKIVHIKPSTQRELDDLIQQQNIIGNLLTVDKIIKGSGDVQKCDYTCVHIQGLPAYVTLHDLQYSFFSGLEFGNRGMQLVQDSNGKSLGEAFAEFSSESECAKALKKDGEMFMRKSVIVKPILKTEMLDLLRMIKQPVGRLNSAPQFVRRSMYYVKTENWPFTISIREVISFFQGFNPIQETVRVQIGNDMQGSAAMVGFRTLEEAERAVNGLNGKYYRQRPIRMELALM